jgi:hypothetical protein
MGYEEQRPAVREFLDMLADLLAEKYFERIDDRTKKIPELRRLITAKSRSVFKPFNGYDLSYGFAEKLPYLKIGDRVLFDVKAMDQWIEKHMVREKEWKRQELKIEIEREKSNSKSSKESDLLSLLKKKKN